MADDYLARAEAITRHAESRDRDYDKFGRPIVSSAGAKYAMQVLPSTARDPGYNVRPAAGDTPEEYNRVGRELFASHMKRYGDPTKAWAAYNWGSGRMDRLQNNHPQDWLTRLPSDVRAYAQGNAKKLGSTAVSKSVLDSPPAGGLGAGGPGARTYVSSGAGGALSPEVEWRKKRDEMYAREDANNVKATAQREAAYEVALARLRKEYPVNTDGLFGKLGAALLSRTASPGFAGLMGNIAPTVSQFGEDRRETMLARSKAFSDLEQQYLLSGTEQEAKSIDRAFRRSNDERPRALGNSFDATPTGDIYNKATGRLVPNADHINGLLQRPDLWREFDTKFGPGAAEQVLAQYGDAQ